MQRRSAKYEELVTRNNGHNLSGAFSMTRYLAILFISIFGTLSVLGCANHQKCCSSTETAVVTAHPSHDSCSEDCHAVKSCCGTPWCHCGSGCPGHGNSNVCQCGCGKSAQDLPVGPAAEPRIENSENLFTSVSTSLLPNMDDGISCAGFGFTYENFSSSPSNLYLINLSIRV
jgi:hypothetical protein